MGFNSATVPRIFRYFQDACFFFKAEAYLEPCQTCLMGNGLKIGNGCVALGRHFKTYFFIGRSTLVGQGPMKSLSSVRPSVTKFSQNWIISFSDIVHDDS